MTFIKFLLAGNVKAKGLVFERNIIQTNSFDTPKTSLVLHSFGFFTHSSLSVKVKHFKLTGRKPKHKKISLIMPM